MSKSLKIFVFTSHPSHRPLVPFYFPDFVINGARDLLIIRRATRESEKEWCRERKRGMKRGTSIKFTRRGEVCIFANVFFTFSTTKEDESSNTVTREILFHFYFIYLHQLESYCSGHSGIPTCDSNGNFTSWEKSIETLIHQKSGTYNQFHLPDAISGWKSSYISWIAYRSLFRCWKYF